MGGAVWQKYMKMTRQMSMPARVNDYWNNLTVTERQSVLFLDEADLVKQLYKLNFSLLCVGLMQRRLKKASSSTADEPTYELLEAMEFMDIGTGIMTVKNELVQDGHASALFELIQANLHGFLSQPYVLSDKDFTQLFFHDSEGVSSWDEYQHLIAMLLEQLIIKSFVTYLERESLRQMEALLQEVDQETKQGGKTSTGKKRKKRRKVVNSSSPSLHIVPNFHAQIDNRPNESLSLPTTPTKKQSMSPSPTEPLTPPASSQPFLTTATLSLPQSHLSPKKAPSSASNAHLASTPRTLNPTAAEFKPMLPLKRKFDSFIVHVESNYDDDAGDTDHGGREYHGRRRRRPDWGEDVDEQQQVDMSRDAELDVQLAQLYHTTSELFGWNFTHNCEYTGAYDGWNESEFFMTQHHPVVRFFSTDCNLCTNLMRCRRHQAEEDARAWRQRALHVPPPVRDYLDHDRYFR
ncbi:hypothetical protein H310_11673 [Aphanomyces invadans]|uniref:Uncharacterized protein n=1 Tax=Aphanomyces invadans TaxID=157072 RepID=A0A024TMV5_9STRA|nr:hypothetical protein H310_11673 [Aphanomyces invadans]ETV94697.1 hypothetical protein H310_11673 [Aphanomyces invadans]|eukprot:XP_008876642.1 hypothetical protein H310_11673 [Aphanomyces invadans]